MNRTHADLLGKLLDEDQSKIVDMCLEIGNLRDYCGEEIAVANAMAESYRSCDLEARIQPISATSANVVGVARGTASAAESSNSLILNSHLDTEGMPPRGSDEERQRLRGTWQEGDLLVGKGIVNAKVHLVTQLFAMRAIRRAEIALSGDVILTGSAQETGMTDGLSRLDEWTGPHVQEGAGARWLVDHGVVADYALVGEPTGFTICCAQAGYLRLRVEVEGVAPYTPFINRGEQGTANPNPFERAAPVIAAIAKWSDRYAASQTLTLDSGTIEPKAQILEIRSGASPFTEYADRCDIFVDIRTVPGTNGLSVKRDLERELEDAGPISAVDCFDYRRGYVAQHAEPLVSALQEAHREVFREEPRLPHPSMISMWQDTNAFNEVGIPSVSYGVGPVPETFTRERFRALRIDQLGALAKVYTLAILQITGDPATP